MKYIILLIMLCWGLDVQGGTGKKLKYIDAEELTIVNKTQPVSSIVKEVERVFFIFDRTCSCFQNE